MTEYSVLFATKISAKSVKDMERKAEQTAEAMSKCLHKLVVAHSYGELKKEDTVQSTLSESGE